MMQIRCRALAAFVALFLFGISGNARGQAGLAKLSDKVIDEVSASGSTTLIVRLLDGEREQAPQARRVKNRQRIATELRTAGVKVSYEFQSIPYLIAKGGSRELNVLAGHSEVEAVTADVPVVGHLGESSTLIGADVVIDTAGFDGSNTIVAVLDTGIVAATTPGQFTSHPDLNDSVILTKRFLDQGSTTGDTAVDGNGHGTAIAGIISSNGTVSPRGVAPGADLVILKVLNDDLTGFISDVAAAVDFLFTFKNTNSRFYAANLSFGTSEVFTDCPCDPTAPGELSILNDAINALSSRGISIVSSVGNQGSFAGATAPACFSSVLSVGAVYDDAFVQAPATGSFASFAGGSFADCADTGPPVDRIPCFVNRGACLDLLAPGYLITSATIGGPAPASGTFFGTSFAVPHVVGSIALLKGKSGFFYPLGNLIFELISKGIFITDIPPPNGTGAIFKRVQVDASEPFIPLNFPPPNVNETGTSWSLYE